MKRYEFGLPKGIAISTAIFNCLENEYDQSRIDDMKDAEEILDYEYNLINNKPSLMEKETIKMSININIDSLTTPEQMEFIHRIINYTR